MSVHRHFKSLACWCVYVSRGSSRKPCMPQFMCRVRVVSMCVACVFSPIAGLGHIYPTKWDSSFWGHLAIKASSSVQERRLQVEALAH